MDYVVLVAHYLPGLDVQLEPGMVFSDYDVDGEVAAALLEAGVTEPLGAAPAADVKSKPKKGKGN